MEQVEAKKPKAKKPEVEQKQLTPLKWPDGWGRTLIAARKSNGAWKNPITFYRDAVMKEIGRLGVAVATISHNDAIKERIDPGVALWFSRKPVDDFSWQSELQLDDPAPTLEQIKKQFYRLAQKHHPDAVNNGSGGDQEVFKRLDDARKRANAWILGTSAPVLDNCIACDRFTEIRLNLAAIRSALIAFRQLERAGIPAILERVMDQAFRVALPTDQGVSNVANTKTA